MCANGEKMVCTQRGTMLVTYKGKRLEIHDALCIKGVANLISVNQLVKMGFVVLFEHSCVSLYASKSDIALNNPFMVGC